MGIRSICVEETWYSPTSPRLRDGCRWPHQTTTNNNLKSWWRHQMETLSALLAHCAGNSPVTGEFPSQRPVTRSCDVFFDRGSIKRLKSNNWDAGDLRRHRAHYGVTVMDNAKTKCCNIPCTWQPLNKPSSRITCRSVARCTLLFLVGPLFHRHNTLQ